MALWLGEAGGAGGEGCHFDLRPRSAVALWLVKLLPGRPRLRGCGGGGLRREEAEFGGLGELQGSVVGSSPLLCLSFLLLFARSFPVILSSLGHGVGGVGIRAAEGAISGSGGAGVGRRQSLGVRWSWASVRQWFLVFLAGGVKYL